MFSFSLIAWYGTRFPLVINLFYVFMMLPTGSKGITKCNPETLQYLHFSAFSLETLQYLYSNVFFLGHQFQRTEKIYERESIAEQKDRFEKTVLVINIVLPAGKPVRFQYMVLLMNTHLLTQKLFDSVKFTEAWASNLRLIIKLFLSKGKSKVVD